MVAETRGINIYAESALHESVKAYLSRAGDRLEALVEGKIVDLVRADGELVEIQTARLDKLAAKVAFLASSAKVRVVHPIAAEKEIIRLDPTTGEILSTRKSPKHGTILSLFDELVKASSLLSVPGLTIEVLLVKVRELRTRDGSGSWRRGGDRTVARELVSVVESRQFSCREDWSALLPRGEVWDSTSLAQALGISSTLARKMLYTLSKTGIIEESGKSGRKKMYRLVS